MAGAAHESLAALGYAFVPGASRGASDWVLRQLADPTKGFEWRGQQHYDALGAAAFRWVRGALCGLCGLEPLSCCEPAVPYATPGLKENTAPLLILVCGSAPGGDAGVWVMPTTTQRQPYMRTALKYPLRLRPPGCDWWQGRSLCLNASCTQGAMFDYCFRAKALGWGVLIADPHSTDCPHTHLVQVRDCVSDVFPLPRFLPCVLGTACPAVSMLLGTRHASLPLCSCGGKWSYHPRAPRPSSSHILTEHQ